jgi:hypothetical protein
MANLTEAARSNGADVRRSRPADRAGLVVAALAAFDALVTIIATRRGAGLEPDAVTFISTARNLIAGNGLHPVHSPTLTIFPPGFPVLLAAGHPLGLDAGTVARIANIAAAAAIVVLTYVLLRRHVRTTTAALLGTAFVALVPPLLEVYRVALSEPLFYVAALAFLLILENLVAPDSAPRWTVFVLPTVLIWVAFSLRYVGLILLITGALMVLLQFRRWGLGAAMRRAVVFGIAGGSLPGAWMVRNTIVGDGPQGGRTGASRGVPTNAYQYLKTVSSWISPPPTALRLLVLAVVAVVVAFGFSRAARSGSLTSAALRPHLTLITFVIVYSVYVIAVASRFAIEILDDRLLMPLVVPLVVLVTWGIETLIDTLPAARRQNLARALVILVLVWMVYPAAKDARDTRDAERIGSGYAAPAWRHSQLAHALAQQSAGVRVYANDPWGLYVGSSRSLIFLGPRLTALNTDRTIQEGPQFAQTVACLGQVLFAVSTIPGGSTDAPTVYTPEQLRHFVRVVPVQTFRDGTLYRVTPLPGHQHDNGAKPGSPCVAPLPKA